MTCRVFSGDKCRNGRSSASPAGACVGRVRGLVGNALSPRLRLDPQKGSDASVTLYCRELPRGGGFSPSLTRSAAPPAESGRPATGRRASPSPPRFGRDVWILTDKIKSRTKKNGTKKSARNAPLPGQAAGMAPPALPSAGLPAASELAGVPLDFVRAAGPRVVIVAWEGCLSWRRQKGDVTVEKILSSIVGHLS